MVRSRVSANKEPMAIPQIFLSIRGSLKELELLKAINGGIHVNFSLASQQGSRLFALTESQSGLLVAVDNRSTLSCLVSLRKN